MCLYIGREKHIRISKRDKVVYKRFYPENDYLVPPFYRTKYRIGKTKTSPIFSGVVDKRIRKFTKFPLGLRTVERGLHSYSNKKHAFAYRNAAQVVVKCVIPKGTPYINGSYFEVVSLALRPVKIIRY
jgi:hypothetical protein